MGGLGYAQEDFVSVPGPHALDASSKILQLVQSRDVATECMWKERSQSQHRQQDLVKLFLKLPGPGSLISVPISIPSGIMTLRQVP